MRKGTEKQLLSVIKRANKLLEVATEQGFSFQQLVENEPLNGVKMANYYGRKTWNHPRDFLDSVTAGWFWSLSKYRTPVYEDIPSSWKTDLAGVLDRSLRSVKNQLGIC